MKYIIFISDNIRQGNFPRVDGFEYSQAYDKYLYAGRELTVGEFNDACNRVFDPDFRNQGFTFRPQAVEPKVIHAPVPVIEEPAAEEPATEEPAAVAEVADITPEPFLLEGRNIFKDGERIAGLFGDDGHLRVSKEHADLRPAIEEWLNTQSI